MKMTVEQYVYWIGKSVKRINAKYEQIQKDTKVAASLNIAFKLHYPAEHARFIKEMGITDVEKTPSEASTDQVDGSEARPGETSDESAVNASTDGTSESSDVR